MHYTLPGIQLESALRLESFEPFAAAPSAELPTVKLEFSEVPPTGGAVIRTLPHRNLDVTIMEDGWLYSTANGSCLLRVSADYRRLTAWTAGPEVPYVHLNSLLRTALECASAQQGVISLHSSCVDTDGWAVAFTGKSGTGKSTRARAWRAAFGVEFISGDRPSLMLRPDGFCISGVPWDGKEEIFNNIRRPLKAVLDVRRSHFTRIRRLSMKQRRQILMQQIFIPMWDTETAGTIIAMVNMLARKAPVYRVFCGPAEDSAREVRRILFEHPEEILEEQMDMKIKPGFVLRNLVGEYVVMPTGNNIGKFDATIVLNEVAAFVWEKMQQPVSREDLAEAILTDFEVDRETASRDLDALIAQFREFGILDEE